MLLLLTAAFAQDADTFNFSGSGWDDRASLQLVHPELGMRNSYYAGLGLVYADDPLVRVYADDSEESVVSKQFSTRLHGGYNINGVARLDVEVPLYPTVVVDGEGAFAFGDITVGALIPVYAQQQGSGVFSFGVKPYLNLPTGKKDAFVSTGFSGGLIAAAGGSYDDTLLWRANLGLRVGKKAALADLDFGSSFDAGFGVAYRITEEVDAGVELTSVVTLTGDNAWNKNPVEGHVFGGYAHESGFTTRLGLGTGLVAGVGAPDYRVALALGYRDPGAPLDSDNDGIIDAEDACPADPEDIDRFEDSDGCPDTDNDEDGILDSDDSCPMDAEDLDAFEDSDGCPDNDNDQDGIPDGGDDCPNEAGPADMNGCPNRDGDALADRDDDCPDEPGPLETQGCPDGDGDLVPDFRDKCPDKKAALNADPKRSDGCPSRVVVTKTSIDILEKVYFDTNKAKIKPVSYGLLDDVAQVINENPDIKLIEVAGHTDDQGADATNLALSQKRAEAVKDYLVSKGVDESRLVPKGYGETTPIDTNRTSAGRANNRRVEFVIKEQ